MAERRPAKKATQQSAKRTTGKASKGFTDEERAAMRERGQELKAAARRGPRAGKADGERDVLAKIAEMPEQDRAMAERLHALVKASAPALSPRTWYGMPAYAKDGNVVCFFQSSTFALSAEGGFPCLLDRGGFLAVGSAQPTW